MSRRKRTQKPSSLARPRGGPTQSERVEALIAELSESMVSKEPVNLSLPSHVVITKALHALALGGRAPRPGLVRITYNDRSQGVSFPVGRLTQTQVTWTDAPVVRVGTLTFRHLDYDDYVHLYLIRDRETRRLRQADIERLAFERMREVLGSERLAGAAGVEFYQTGLEPLVVGALRAVVKVLAERTKQGASAPMLRSVFHVKADGQHQYGPVWGASP